MPRNFNHPAQVVLTYGTMGVGKTTHVVSLLRQQNCRIFVYDHKHEICQKLGVRCAYSLAELAEAANRGGVVCFDYSVLYPGQKRAGFTFFCDFVYSFSEAFRGRKILFTDELQKLVDPHKEVPLEVAQVIDDGRCVELDLWAVSHGANRVHTWVRAQATEVYTFRQADENSVKILAKDYGFNPDAVRELQPGQWLYRNVNSGQAGSGGKAFIPKGTRNPRPAVARPTVERSGESAENKRVEPESLPAKDLPEVRSEKPA